MYNLILMFMNNLILLFGIIRERFYNIWSDYFILIKFVIKILYFFFCNVYKFDMLVRIVNVCL